MFTVLQVTFPFFALVLGGYVAARRGVLPLPSIAGLNSFVLFFALPCMLYRFGANTPLAQLLDAAVLFTWLFCGLVIVAFVVAISLNARVGWNDAAFGALVAAFPNTGFMGVPLLIALLGPAAAGPVIVSIMADMVITSSLCIALSRLGDKQAADGGRAVSQAARKALKGVAANPLLWAILLGTLSSALSVQLPDPVSKTIGLLAEAASPVALFTIGAVLARARMDTSSGAQAPVALGDYLPVVLVKLLLHPVLVLLVGITAIALGVPLDRFALLVLVLIAALPSASNVSLLAERYGANTGRIALIILVSTATAFFSFSGAVALLSGR